VLTVSTWRTSATEQILQRYWAVASEYISNFGPRVPYLRVCSLSCDFTACWFASFAAVDQRLPEQRRTGDTGV
jgi:hypothetical protein